MNSLKALTPATLRLRTVSPDSPSWWAYASLRPRLLTDPQVRRVMGGSTWGPKQSTWATPVAGQDRGVAPPTIPNVPGGAGEQSMGAGGVGGGPRGRAGVAPVGGVGPR